MTLSLRHRILLTLAPLLLLLVGIGTAGVVLLSKLAGRADLILRENYDSVRAMSQLNEALGQIDAAFRLALSGREGDARRQYQENWLACDKQLRIQQANITLPGEAELTDRLTRLTREYRALGDRFFAHPPGSVARAVEYSGGVADSQLDLPVTYRLLKGVSGDILRINQENMEAASRDARALAATSQVGLGLGLAGAVLLALLFAWRLLRAVLGPVGEMTRAAEAIGTGQLHLTVPVYGRDELGQLATAFNTMTRHLREYRQVNTTRLLRAQQTGQATIDSFPDPVLVVDPDGRVELANPAARRVLGVAPAANGDAPAWQPPDALRQPLADALRLQRPFLTESFDQVVAFHLDGEDRAFLPQIRPIQDRYGGTLGAAVILDDVTKFRVLDRLKSDLVATVSHELKTPLTSIRLAVHVLLEEAVGPLTPKQTELLLDARDNAERLLRMIESLLALAKIEGGGRLRAEPARPAELLRAAAEAAGPRAADKRVDLTVEAAAELPPVAVDRERFGRALDNLLDNALAYTNPGGRVTLSAEAADGGRVRFAVTDTGVGIPPEALPHVFEKFFRVPGQTQPAGTGLGLAIVREIVVAHGGEITCASTTGRGTTFTITLPAHA
jgi:two-component system, NtrC family, sensor histidine kinase KinB